MRFEGTEDGWTDRTWFFLEQGPHSAETGELGPAGATTVVVLKQFTMDVCLCPQ